MDVCLNPQGILFNPMSLAACLEAVCNGVVYEEADLFRLHETWNHWDFHSRFSDISKAAALGHMNRSIAEARLFLERADWLILTFGSSFQYFLQPAAGAAAGGKYGQGVGNCHKAPGQWFEKRMLTADAMEERWKHLLERLRALNPGLKIMLTISPVRHVRDGLVENNQSKARLFELVQRLTDQYPGMYYFPAFEIVNDVLRDYRFFAQDMVHPGPQAVQYVWEQFCKICFEPGTESLLERIAAIDTALQHRPRFEDTKAHQQFRQQLRQKIEILQRDFPYLNYHTALEILR